MQWLPGPAKAAAKTKSFWQADSDKIEKFILFNITLP
jgi:hypothetical protein